MTKAQEKIMEKLNEGHTTFGGKYGRTLKALEAKGLVKNVRREEKTTHIKDFKEYVIHGQYRTGEVYKKVTYVVYKAELV